MARVTAWACAGNNILIFLHGLLPKGKRESV